MTEIELMNLTPQQILYHADLDENNNPILLEFEFIKKINEKTLILENKETCKKAFANFAYAYTNRNDALNALSNKIQSEMDIEKEEFGKIYRKYWQYVIDSNKLLTEINKLRQ